MKAYDDMMQKFKYKEQSILGLVFHTWDVTLRVGEQSPPTGFGCTGKVCTNSQCENGQCTVPKRLANMDGGSARKPDRKSVV